MGIPLVKSGSAPAPLQPSTTKQLGDQAENLALAHLQHAGLRLLERNYRTPGRGGGEIDLIMRALETDIKVFNCDIKSLTGVVCTLSA